MRIPTAAAQQTPPTLHAAISPVGLLVVPWVSVSLAELDVSAAPVDVTTVDAIKVGISAVPVVICEAELEVEVKAEVEVAVDGRSVVESDMR
jgi:hypothetical protein